MKLFSLLLILTGLVSRIEGTKVQLYTYWEPGCPGWPPRMVEVHEDCNRIPGTRSFSVQSVDGGADGGRLVFFEDGHDCIGKSQYTLRNLVEGDDTSEQSWYHESPCIDNTASGTVWLHPYSDSGKA
jgi:hypothetical protein